MARVGVSFVRKDKLGAYLTALEDAGLETVPLSPSDSDPTLDGLDGLLLTGGGDLDPARYGAERHPLTKHVIGERDELELALLAEAERRNLPVLGICRGLQLLNLARGGTLHQHIEGHKGTDHAVTIEGASRAAAIFGAGDYLVNSRHHQAVDRLGAGLAISARAADGTVEAVEDPTRPFVMAVQWHPEDRPATGDGRLFRAFAEAVRR